MVLDIVEEEEHKVLKKDTVTNEDQVYTIVDKMPEYPGGEISLMKYVSKNLYLSRYDREDGLGTKLIVRFIIDEKGNTIKPEIIRGIAPASDLQLIEALKEMPKWKPGEHQEQKVKVWYTLSMHVDFK